MHDLSSLLQRPRVPWRRLSDDVIEEVAREAANAGDEVLRVRALRALARRDSDPDPYRPTCHHDRTVTYWSVYRQAWVVRSSRVPDAELAAMDAPTRARVIRHLAVRS
jgi:hypothetical protein